MTEFDSNVRIVEIQKDLTEVSKKVDQLMRILKPDEDLWDNSELCRKWKISERTLATWRKEGLIKFVKVKDKIWYPRTSREEFLSSNLICD